MEMIKEIGKFILWWWKNLSPHTKIYVPTLFWFLSLIPGYIYFGIGYFVFWFVSVFICFLILIANFVIQGIVCSWKNFQHEQEKERQRTINKLQGKEDSLSRSQVILNEIKSRKII